MEMRAAYKNIVKGYSQPHLLSIAKTRAIRKNEDWHVALNGQMAFNDKGRKGYEHYSTWSFRPNRTQYGIDANGEITELGEW